MRHEYKRFALPAHYPITALLKAHVYLCFLSCSALGRYHLRMWLLVTLYTFLIYAAVFHPFRVQGLREIGDSRPFLITVYPSLPQPQRPQLPAQMFSEKKLSVHI